MDAWIGGVSSISLPLSLPPSLRLSLSLALALWPPVICHRFLARHEKLRVPETLYCIYMRHCPYRLLVVFGRPWSARKQKR